MDQISTNEVMAPEAMAPKQQVIGPEQIKKFTQIQSSQKNLLKLQK